MKTVLSVIVLSLFGNSLANAGALKCRAADGGSSSQYLLVYNLSSEVGAIFKSALEYDIESWDLVYPDAKVVMALDGGPLSISGSDNSEVDWKKEERCFKFKNPTYRFRLNLAGQGATGELGIYPNIDVNPRTTCAVPRPMVPRPVSLTCIEL